MALTTQQLQTLKADITAKSAPGQPFEGLNPLNADHAVDVFAPYYNAIASPEFIVWRTNVSTYDIRNVIVWAEYDTLSVSKQNAFQLLISNGIVNAASANVRQGIQSIFAAPGQSGNLAAMIAISKRTARRIEQMFATGTGTTQSPGTMVFEGMVSYQDILAAASLGS